MKLSNVVGESTISADFALVASSGVDLVVSLALPERLFFSWRNINLTATTPDAAVMAPAIFSSVLITSYGAPYARP